MKPLSTYLLLFLSLSAVSLAQAPQAPGPTPEITFQQCSVTVAGISAKGQAAGFSVAREIADLTTGAVAAAAPEGYPLRRVSWRGGGIARGNPRADRVEDARAFAEVLLVRPGQGAWRLTVGDGSDLDDDGKPDGKLAAALDRMEPLAGTSAPPPSRFDPRDVVVLIDPNRMELTVVQAGNPGGPKAAGVTR